MGKRSRSRSDSSDAESLGIIVVIAALWWLRWLILAGLIFAGVGLGILWLLRQLTRRHAAEIARIGALRQRAEVQNAQVLRGNPAGFFGYYPLPDPELIPRWYKAG